MLIPSIDLQGGAVVQLVQGERLAIKDDDVFRWVRRFEKFPRVQVIDLDAALAASIFHYAETGVRAHKEYLQQRGIPVRL